MTVTIRVGDCRDWLGRMEPESVHMVCTSPPYWGLRSYSVPPTIWGGNPECVHVWGEELIASANDSNRGSMEWTTGGDPGAKVKGQRPSQGQFCQCGAWLGTLPPPRPDGVMRTWKVEVGR